jgi:3-oxoadipate enol-lactonase
MDADRAVAPPGLAPGRSVGLPAGTVTVRDIPGPPGAAALVLLHGWTATADLNFFRIYEPLAEHFRVVAFDHRGHGAGIRTRGPFRLEDCADDVVAMADAIGLDRFVVLGYSMGGAIAQLLWRRHGDRLTGLVLAATASHFNAHRSERLSFLGLTGLAAAARITPVQAHRWVGNQVYLQRKVDAWDPWAVAQASAHDWRMIAEAGRAIGRFRSDDWLGEIDVPTSVIVTMHDEVIPLTRQIQLFGSIRDAEAYRVDGGHDAAVTKPARFVREATRATTSVAERATIASPRCVPGPLPPSPP